MELDRRQPRYLEVRNALLEDMRRGLIHDGQRIPTEPELCERFSVSRITVRRAVEELVREGALEKRHGVGTFARVSGFAPSLMSLGGFGAATHLRSKPRRRVVHAEEIWLGPEDAVRLGQVEGAPGVRLYRVLLDGEQPLGLDETIYPSVRVPGFLDDFQEDASTFQYLTDKYGLVPSASTGILKLGYASLEEAELLGLPTNEAVIRVDKLISDQTSQPIVISRLVLHPVRTNVSFEAGRPHS